ncbi:MAG TPA: hypothetical protein VGE65_09370 [Sphingobium sp.]
MKISRYEPVRRRRSPFPLLLILAAVIVIGVLVAAWMKGGSQPQQHIEIAIPPEQLGR